MNASAIIEKPSSGLWKPSGWLGFLWGFAEGTVFFIIPDVIISWAALAGARYGVRIMGAVLAGALVAGIVMYTWATERPDQSRAVVAAVPFVRERMFDKVQQDYAEHGLSGMLYGPSSGIPYKVYAVLAPAQHQPLNFLLLSIPARLERFIASWLLFTGIGWAFQRWVRRHTRLTAFLFAIFWVVTYALYWSRL
jgi:hypothetical protein